jgi:hypothetical protein
VRKIMKPVTRGSRTDLEIELAIKVVKLEGIITSLYKTWSQSPSSNTCDACDEMEREFRRVRSVIDLS